MRMVFAAGLAFRAMLSVSGIWGQLQFGFGRLPPKLPPVAPEVNGKFRRSQELKKHKKTRVLAGFVDVIGCFRMLSDQVKWWSRGESNPRP